MIVSGHWKCINPECERKIGTHIETDEDLKRMICPSCGDLMEFIEKAKGYIKL